MDSTKDIIFAKNIFYRDIIKDSSIEQRSLVDIHDKNLKRRVNYICDVCGLDYFVGNNIKHGRLHICKNHKFYTYCSICNKEYEIAPSKDGINDLHGCSGKCRSEIRIKALKQPQNCRSCGKYSKEGLNAFGMCIKCSIEHNRQNIRKSNEAGNCARCNKFSETRKDGFCLDCNSKKMKNIVSKNKKAGNCSICGILNNSRDQNGRGKDCGCSQKWYFEHNNDPQLIKSNTERIMEYWKDPEYASRIAKNLGDYCVNNFIVKDNVRFYKGIEVNQFSSKILSGELDIDDYPGINIRCGRVCYGAENILTSEKILMANNFTELDGVKFYKNTEIHELIRQLDSGEIEIPPGFNKRFGEWYYKTENILTGEITKLNHCSFEERNNVLFYLDRTSEDYMPWEDYKDKFSTYNIHFKLPEGFKMHSTFRTQDSNSWRGSREAFEQSLVEANISWFVYIKFDENNRPLVVGKSGSKLVNEQSDVSFSTDINDGPARKFLNESNLDWCKTQIAICPCKTEQEAINLEKEIGQNYHLFFS